MGLAAVLFDLDGVLVDSRTAISRSMNHALEQSGFSTRPEPELHPLIGPPLHDAFSEILEESATPERVDACVAHYRDRYRSACIEETLLFDGMAAAVEELAARWPLVIATSKPTEFARPILEAQGIAHHFRAIVGPSLAARSEPKAETVARALMALGDAPRGEAAMVGDRRHDVVAGRAHALVTVGVTWGIGSREELDAAGVDWMVGSPTELVERIRAL